MMDAIKAWFKRSETIFWARVQVAAGIAGAVFTGALADPNVNSALQSVLKPDYVPYYLIAMGLLTEYLRRRRATDL